ncbi:MAG TPA: GNAT family N-acetyltransferase [Phenylobacterium sp.]|jgi:RimJ/RimL family protein N-acetyltransferase|uniref:GNAT family N-acetyltransferase n=1 Tax=Phenylobacterium sp. TaxID=1871053 RepID=UPI002D7073DD|nr:GNAT family N-acetyltransferase [Phenylobacterium sp.]HZZ68396.1 GNAT family N-acetyltransferase [Phenylobacterium sp.]
MCVIDRPETTSNRSGARDEIRTDRLILRAPAAGDVAAIARLAGDYAIASMTTRMPHPYAEADARQFVALVARQDTARERTFTIERQGEGAIGAIGFHRALSGLLELGYWLGRPHWGRGYATEAVAGALHWASADWGRKAVSSGHFADNAPSANVLIKSGFLYTGEVQMRHSRARGRIAPTRMMVWLA